MGEMRGAAVITGLLPHSITRGKHEAFLTHVHQGDGWAVIASFTGFRVDRCDRSGEHKYV